MYGVREIMEACGEGDYGGTIPPIRPVSSEDFDKAHLALGPPISGAGAEGGAGESKRKRGREEGAELDEGTVQGPKQAQGRAGGPRYGPCNWTQSTRYHPLFFTSHAITSWASQPITLQTFP